MLLSWRVRECVAVLDPLYGAQLTESITEVFMSTRESRNVVEGDVSSGWLIVPFIIS